MRASLAAKLIAALVVLLAITSLVYVGLTVAATRLHMQEINQSLHRELAAKIVASKPLIRDDQVNPEALHEVFDMLMEMNPAIEVYLLDPAGRILDYSAPPNSVKRSHVALEPIDAFLGGLEGLPIRGDDPRDAGGRKIFSVAPVRDDGRLQGYLYVVLGGAAYDTIAGMFEKSHILRLTLGAVVASLVLTGAAGALYFYWLTRRLRRLASLMRNLRESEFRAPVAVPKGWFRTRGDEIDQLGRTFEAMSQRIVGQVQALKQADASRRELFANVSHDLRTPLALLRGSIETLLMKKASLTAAEKRHYLDVALRHSEQLERLTTRVFELATLESGDRGYRAESFSIPELLQDVAQRFRPEAQRHGLTIECSVSPDVPFVTADIGLIERVFENLIGNAMRYTPEGGAIRLSVMPGEGRVAVEVADTGCGIPAAELEHIFDRKYRTGKEGQDRPGGAGLGLAIAHRILQLHGSAIEIESTVGVGTALRFFLRATAEALSHEDAAGRPAA